jgi:hypothetical protein
MSWMWVAAIFAMVLLFSLVVAFGCAVVVTEHVPAQSSPGDSIA